MDIPRPGAKVLIVDDEPIIVHLMADPGSALSRVVGSNAGMSQSMERARQFSASWRNLTLLRPISGPTSLCPADCRAGRMQVSKGFVHRV
jgi:hypothetical protein